MGTGSVRDRHRLAALFAERGYTKGVEVGVADGRYSLVLCETIPGLRLHCIDPWAPYKGNGRGGGTDQHARNYQLAKERLAPYGAHLIPGMSQDYAETFEDGELDFVYLDGNHDFDYVMLDLILWTPKVREGGVVAGHDFYDFDSSGVIEAVEAYTSFHEIDFLVTRERREKSWYWTR